MSTNSNDQGRAYEYAWINTLYRALSAIRKTRIVNNSSLDANKRAWSVMDDDMQELFEISANSAGILIAEFSDMHEFLLLHYCNREATILPPPRVPTW